MITRIKGKLVASGVDWVELELTGVTLRIFVPENTVGDQNLIGDILSISTVFVIKDDSPILYGFKDIETRSVFESLIKVGGIGPKLALSILSKFDYNSLTLAVESGDVVVVVVQCQCAPHLRCCYQALALNYGAVQYHHYQYYQYVAVVVMTSLL